ncbi:MAG: radical SAM family heme chaperone HemW [Chloroflexi bacterium]|nr:radical SAM family heme chaperone HemW [Chloroflexota bacterium]
MAQEIALYIHIPFCRQKCGYCDFVSYAGREAEVPAYVSALKQEMGLRGKGQRVRTLYFGGGTPSLLCPPDVAEILSAARSHFDAPEDAETTLEANPGTIDGPYLASIRDAGINRLSLGVQRLNDGELRLLGRLHDEGEAREAVRLARQAGFTNLNLDLIYGIPGYGLPGAALESWQATLREAVALGPEHLSLYSLTLDEGTPLHDAVADGRLPAPDPDAAAQQYEFAEDFLDAGGYRHYEISNWSKEGFECRHNLVYWKNEPYLGIGVAAHSYVDGRRLANTSDIAEYITAMAQGRTAIVQDEEIGPDLDLSETVILGLRLVEGIKYTDLWRRFGIDSLRRYRRQVRELLQAGLLESDGTFLRLTRRGRLLGNEVFWRFLPGNQGEDQGEEDG